MSSPHTPSAPIRKTQPGPHFSSNGSSSHTPEDMRRSAPSTSGHRHQSPSNGSHAAPNAPSGADGLERILTKLTDHLANVERRIGRLEQSNYDQSSSQEAPHQSPYPQSPRRPSEPGRASTSQNHTFRQPMPPPSNYHAPSPSSQTPQYIDAARYRHSMLLALSQSEELILRLVDDNNRLRRRLDGAHREINRLRGNSGDFPLPESKRSKTRSGLPSSGAAYFMNDDSDDEAETVERMGGIEPSQTIAPRVNVAYPNGYEPAKRRFSVSSESFHPEILTQPSVIRALPKTDDQLQILAKTLKENALLQHLEKERILDIARAMWDVPVLPGNVVIRQGDDGDNMYVIEDGEFEVLYSDEVVAKLGRGRSFGEHALMYNCPRNATVRAVVPSRLWAIDRETFRRIIMQESIKRRALYQDFLSGVPLLQSLLEYERAKVSDALEPIEFEDGAIIIKQGSTDVDGFYIIEDGTVRCTKEPEPLPDGATGSGEAIEAIRLGSGDYFGELALLTNKPRAATVAAVGHVKLLRITKLHFDQVMGPCEQILKRNMETYTSYAKLIRGEKQQRMSGSRPQSTDVGDNGAGENGTAPDVDAVANAFVTAQSRNSTADNLSRKAVLTRAIASEEEYVSCLYKLVFGYAKGFREHAELKVSEQDIETIFSNVNELYAIHKNFLASLRSCLEHPEQLFTVISTFISQLPSYIPFVRCYYSSIVVRRRRRIVPSFVSFLRSVQGNDKDDIDALLDQAFRRVNHYGQLLLDLLQTSPQGEPTHLLAQEAKTVLKKLEDTRVSAAQVYVILQNIAGDVNYTSNPDREYVTEERLTAAEEIEAENGDSNVYTFLFDDLLVCAAQIDTGSGKPKLAHRNTISLDKAGYTPNENGTFSIGWERPDGHHERITFKSAPKWEDTFLRVLTAAQEASPVSHSNTSTPSAQMASARA